MDNKNVPPKVGTSRGSSIYYSLTEELELTTEEKLKLEAVMKKAQDFEAEEVIRMRAAVEGKLYKYTNVMKGWQYRWFVLTPDTGMLEYYMLDERKKNRPRGALHLAGALITVSEDDSQSFAISAVCGEVFKVKASDGKERQYWVERIRAVAEKYSKDDSSLRLLSTQPTNFNQSNLSLNHSTFHTMQEIVQTPSQVKLEESGRSLSPPIKKESLLDSFTEIKESVSSAIECQKTLAKSVEDLPHHGSNIKCSDRTLLLLKATSQAAVQSLEQCYLILRQRQRKTLNANNSQIGIHYENVEKHKPH